MRPFGFDRKYHETPAADCHPGSLLIGIAAYALLKPPTIVGHSPTAAENAQLR
jgi:hypothetical protein